MTKYDTNDDGELVNDDGETLKWGKPHDARRYHIFDGGRAICSSGWLLFPDEAVDSDAEYAEGQDCKNCCRKAGLIDQDP